MEFEGLNTQEQFCAAYGFRLDGLQHAHTPAPRRISVTKKDRGYHSVADAPFTWQQDQEHKLHL